MGQDSWTLKLFEILEGSLENQSCTGGIHLGRAGARAGDGTSTRRGERSWGFWGLFLREKAGVLDGGSGAKRWGRKSHL